MIKEPLIVSDLEYPDRRTKRANALYDIKNDLNEPTLVYLLVCEENQKVKLAICKTISTILDGYSGDKILLTIDSKSDLYSFQRRT